MTNLTKTLLRGAAALAVTGALLSSTGTGALAANTVPNDNLADAEPITALPFTHDVDLVGASTEPDEPISACDFVSHTVWYVVSVPADTAVTVDTAGSGTDTIVVVWDDPVLHDPVTCANNSGESVQAAVTFAAHAGVTYLLQVGVDGQTGALPGLLHLSVTEAQRPTGRPEVTGVRHSATFAGAFFHTPLESGYHNTQLDVSTDVEHIRGDAPQSSINIHFESRRSQVRDGVKVNEDWFFVGSVDPSRVRLSAALRGASAELDLTVQRSVCIVAQSDEPADCSELPAENLTVRGMWTGTGDVQRDLFKLAERGFGFHATGAAQLAWRDADATLDVTGDFEQHLTRPFGSVLSRTGDSSTTWSRS